MRGIIFRIGTALAVSFMVAFMKLASTYGAGLAEISFYRSLVGLIMVLFWVLPREGIGGLVPRQPLALLGRNALALTALFASFQALILLPLAEAITIGFTAPMFATLLSWLLLGERPGAHRWLAALVAFLGVVVMMRPGADGFEAISLLGGFLALAGGLAAAGGSIALRQMAGVEKVGTIVFWFQANSVLVSVLLIPLIGTNPPWQAIFLLLIAGLFGGLSQIWMTASLQAAPVSVVAPFDYIQLIAAALLGWLMIGIVPTGYTWAGAVLIGGSGLYTAWRERRSQRQIPLRSGGRG